MKQSAFAQKRRVLPHLCQKTWLKRKFAELKSESVKSVALLRGEVAKQGKVFGKGMEPIGSYRIIGYVW